jgi:hypothetical protein
MTRKIEKGDEKGDESSASASGVASGASDETQAYSAHSTPIASAAEPPEMHAAPAELTESAAEAAAAPVAESAPAERDFDVTLKSNLSDQEQTVIARGTDPGLAAQTAMRQHPGWTAEHEKTRPHEEHATPPTSER